MSTSGPASRPVAQAIGLIASVERLVPELSPDEQMDVHNALVALWKTLQQHLFSPQGGPAAPARNQSDRVLTLEEAAAYLRRSRSWLYHHWQPLHLGYRDGGRLRFRQRDLDEYVNAKRTVEMESCHGGSK